MIELLNEDILIHNIIPLLNWTDLFSVKRVSKSTYRAIKYNHFIKNCVKNINSRLFIIFGDKLADFKKLLSSTQSFITGPFVIECILNEKWKGSDINIYVGDYNEHSSLLFHDFISKIFPVILSDYIKCGEFYIYVYANDGNRIVVYFVDNCKSYNDLYNFIMRTSNSSVCEFMYFYDDKKNSESLYQTNFQHIKNITELLGTNYYFTYRYLLNHYERLK